MKAKEKNYLTSWCKKIEFDNGGHIHNIRVKVEDVMRIEKDGWAKIVLAERREPSQTGATHYLYEDTWEPDPNYSVQNAIDDMGDGEPTTADKHNSAASDDDDDDLPF